MTPQDEKKIDEKLDELLEDKLDELLISCVDKIRADIDRLIDRL